MVPGIELSAKIFAPASLVFRLLSEVERFPDLCPGLRRVKIIWRSGPHALSRWEMWLGATSLGWTQQDLFDLRDRRISYHLIYGDAARLEGEWWVRELSECSSAVSGLLFLELAPAPVEAARGREVRRQMRRSLALLLEAVRRRLEGS